MTIAVYAPNQYTGNGVNKTWDYDFKIWKTTDIEVWLTENDVDTKVTSNYTVNDSGAVGGNVTYPDTGSAIASTVKITIKRKTPTLQDYLNLINNGPFLSETIEEAMDRMVTMVQQNTDDLTRCPKVGETEDATSTEDFLNNCRAAQLAAETAQTGAETAQDAAEDAVNDVVVSYQETTASEGDTYVDVSGFNLASDLDNIGCWIQSRKRPKSALTRTSDTRLTFGLAIPANSTFGANFKINENGDWGDGLLKGSLEGDTYIDDGYVKFGGTSGDGIHWSGIGNADAPQTGTFRVVVVPKYSGTPPDDQIFFNVSKISAAESVISLQHDDLDGKLKCTTRDQGGAVTAIDFGSWSPVADTEYELELNYDFTSGATRLFIDGVQQGSTSSLTQTLDASEMEDLTSGEWTGSAQEPQFWLKSLMVFDAVQHTSAYTPATDFPLALSGGEIIEVRSVIFSPTAVGEATAAAASAAASKTAAETAESGAETAESGAQTAQAAAEATLLQDVDIKTGNYTLALGDRTLEFDITADAALTIPPNSSVPVPVGSLVEARVESGSSPYELTITKGSGVSFRGAIGNVNIKISGYDSYSVLLEKTDTDEWLYKGSFQAV